MAANGGQMGAFYGRRPHYIAPICLLGQANKKLLPN